MAAARSFVSPVWCHCGVDGEHLAPVGCAGAGTLGAGAVQQGLTSQPHAPLVASSHHTGRTPNTVGPDDSGILTFADREPRSYGVSTPMGRTTRFSQPY